MIIENMERDYLIDKIRTINNNFSVSWKIKKEQQVNLLPEKIKDSSFCFVTNEESENNSGKYFFCCEGELMLMNRAFITVDEAADYLGVCRRTIYKYLDEGKLNRYKVSRRIYIKIRELESMINKTAKGDENE